MNRLLVFLLAAFDAIVAAAVGIAVLLAPLTLLWIWGLGGEAPWTALWPAAAKVWQLGHLVPLTVELPASYLAATGIPAEAATFLVSLAPLAFAGFAAVFAFRSGRRAARAGVGFTGASSGTLVFAALAAVIQFTSSNPIATTVAWQAILLPAAVFAAGAFAGAIQGAWQWGDDGIVDGVRDYLDVYDGWRALPEAVLRGAAIAIIALLGFGAVGFTVSLALRGGEVIALYESAHVDALGATTLTLGQLAYLPTLVVWSAAFIAGSGFAVGTGTSISPAGTSAGVVPGVPIFGALPETSSSVFLLLALLVVACGVLAGWAARSRIVADSEASDPMSVRLAATLLIAALAAGAAALLGVISSGSIGPDRMAHFGPHPGAFALVVGGEVLLGAAIMLLSPRRDGDSTAEQGEVVPDRGASAAAAGNPRDVAPAVVPASVAAQAELADAAVPEDPAARNPDHSPEASPDELETAPIDPLDDETPNDAR